MTLAIALGGCGDDGGVEPIVFDALPVNAQTVEAAVEYRTQEAIEIPASCDEGFRVNCVAGAPGSPVYMTVTPSNFSAREISPTTYSFSLNLAVATQQAVPITYMGAACNISVNSAAGESPTFQVSGMAEFVSQTDDETLNRIDLAADLLGIEEVDVSLSGGALCDMIASTGTVNEMLSENVGGLLRGSLCGALGPELFTECPAAQGTAAVRLHRGR